MIFWDRKTPTANIKYLRFRENCPVINSEIIISVYNGSVFSSVGSEIIINYQCLRRNGSLFNLEIFTIHQCLR